MLPSIEPETGSAPVELHWLVPLVPVCGTLYSITSSARSIIDGGTARPSALAVLRFTAISNFVGNAPGDRPASRRAGCDPHRRRHDEVVYPVDSVGKQTAVSGKGRLPVR